MNEVLAHLDAHFDTHLDRVRAYVRQPSISGEGQGMEAMAALVRDSILEVSGTAEIVPTHGWPVVYGTIDAGRPKTLLLYGMYDVQPVEGEEWMVPPFSGDVVDLPGFGSSMVARGVYNTKGPLAGLFNVLESILASDGRLPVNLKFVIEGEEELSSPHTVSPTCGWGSRASSTSRSPAAADHGAGRAPAASTAATPFGWEIPSGG